MIRSAAETARGDGGPRPRHRHIVRGFWRVLARMALAIVLLLLLVSGGMVVLLNQWTGNIERLPDVFAGLDETTRPAASDQGQTTFLLLGLDVRAEELTTGTAAATPNSGSRTDAIMLVVLQNDGSGVRVASIPRDSWVDVPGHGMNKINAAHAYGGPSLLVETVEKVTGIRVDHVAAIDFRGFAALTDAVGGVSVEVARDTANWGHEFTEGTNLLDGQRALWYIRQRMDLPGGDLGRVQRQQNFLRSMMTSLARSDVYRSPTRVNALLQAVTQNISLDDGLADRDLMGLARVLLQVDRENLEFFTAPVTGTGLEGEQSVVYLDAERGERFWRALGSGGRLDPDSGAEVLPNVPN